MLVMYVREGGSQPSALRCLCECCDVSIASFSIRFYTGVYRTATRKKHRKKHFTTHASSVFVTSKIAEDKIDSSDGTEPANSDFDMQQAKDPLMSPHAQHFHNALMS
jgi:hypothetical protein